MTDSTASILAGALGVIALFVIFLLVPWLQQRRINRDVRACIVRARLQQRFGDPRSKLRLVKPHEPQTRETLARTQRMRIERRRP